MGACNRCNSDSNAVLIRCYDKDTAVAQCG